MPKVIAATVVPANNAKTGRDRAVGQMSFLDKK
jgi:hypothetical protein